MKNPRCARPLHAPRLVLKPLAALMLAALAAPAQANEFTGLGFLGTGTSSRAYGVSADGSVVVGYGLNSAGNLEAFRWSGGTMTGLGFLGTGTWSHASGVSADGSVVVGQARNSAGNYEAFRWSGGAMTGLGFLPGGTWSRAYGVSADGSVVVGANHNGTNYEAFRWTNNTMTGLGFLPGGTWSRAYGVSADGSVVVGEGRNSAGNPEAFRWTQAGGMTGLGFLGGSQSWATGVSADGNVVVGYAHRANAISEAFRWTSSGGMIGLGALAGGNGDSRAFAVSADGNVVVGIGTTTGNVWRAFRWSQSTNMQSVADWLAGGGVTVPAGWQLEVATGVNGNGNVLVGYGEDPAGNGQAWLARVGPAGSGFLGDIPAFNATLREAGGRAVQAGVALPNLALFGAHHRSLLDNGLARVKDGACAWATADAARYDSTDTRMELAEAGVCKDIGTARLGAGIGQAWARQDWSQGGGAKYDGQYLLVEAANAFGNRLEASVTGYYGKFDTRLNRNYLNGANVDTSSGTPDATSTALRLRADWQDAAKLGQFSLSPYAAYTWMETKLDAYTETGGGFPAQFDAAKWQTDDLRVGVAGKSALSAATDLRLGLEAVHRLDDSTNGVNVQVPNTNTLLGGAIPGQQVKQTWARATVDVDHRLSNKVALTVGANAASSGGDATWGVTAGLRANF